MELIVAPDLLKPWVLVYPDTIMGGRSDPWNSTKRCAFSQDDPDVVAISEAALEAVLRRTEVSLEVPASNDTRAWMLFSISQSWSNSAGMPNASYHPETDPLGEPFSIGDGTHRSWILWKQGKPAPMVSLRLWYLERELAGDSAFHYEGAPNAETVSSLAQGTEAELSWWTMESSRPYARENPDYVERLSLVLSSAKLFLSAN